MGCPSLGRTHLTGLAVFFYADNGHIDGDDNSNVQEGLNVITELF
jgi:hypothetical protein